MLASERELNGKFQQYNFCLEIYRLKTELFDSIIVRASEIISRMKHF
jgi:hypothetical protein